MLRKPRLLCLFFGLTLVFMRAFALDTSDYAVSPPDLFIANGVLVGPVQLVADSLGAKIKLEQKTLTVTRGEVTLTCTINSTAASIGATPLTLPKAPFLANDRLYVPVATLVRVFGGTIVLDTKAGYAKVTLPDRTGPLHFPLISLDEWRGSDRSGDNALYVINLDGSGLRRICFNGGYITSPAFSPNGTLLVYSRNSGIYLRHVQQADEVCLAAGSIGIEYFAPCFTPDSQYILFQCRLMDTKKTPQITEQIWRIKPDGTEKRLLGTGVRTSISPDSRTIAYMIKSGDNTEMRLMDINGGQQRSLGHGRDPIFSPDGKGILYTDAYAITVKSGKTDRKKKWIDLLNILPLDGGAAVSPSAPTEEIPSERDAIFSPDGKQIVYRGKGLAIMNADRTVVKQLTTDLYDKSPAVTSDGRQIVFLRGGGSMLRYMEGEDEDMEFILDFSLVSIKPDGSEEMDIYEDMDVEEFAVAPNGRQIVFVSDPEPPATTFDPMKEAEPAYTLADVERYLAELVPMVEGVAGRKFTTTPAVRLAKRRELVPVMATEMAPLYRNTFGNDEMEVHSLARMGAKSGAPAVLGKYGLKDQALYLLPGNIAPIEHAAKISPMHREALIKLIIAHELTHALQDQVVDLEAQMAKAGTLEKMLACSAIAEGFAVYVQDGVAEKLKASSTAREMARMLAIAITPSGPTMFLGQSGSMQSFREIYLGGRDFIDWQVQRNGLETAWQILASPPVKTSVILHPERYAGDARPEVDLTPVLREAVLKLGAVKKKMLTLELGEITLREFFALLEAQERDGFTAGLDQFYLSAGQTEEADNVMLMLATFNDQAQLEPFAKAIEKLVYQQFRYQKVTGDKQSPLEGITADFTRKRVIAAGDQRLTIVSAGRGKLLLILALDSSTKTDKELAGILEEAFKQVDALRPLTPPDTPVPANNTE
ncbi:MAG: stalk domain-containing protein [Armatimonadota bacterium]